MTCCRSRPGRAMKSVHCDDGLMGYSSCPKISRDSLRCPDDKMTNSTPAFGSVSPSEHPIAHLIKSIEGAVGQAPRTGQQPLLPLHTIGLLTRRHRLMVLAELISRLVDS